MSIQEIMVSGGGFLLIMMTLVQIAPLKINPWSAIGSLIGKAINGDVMKKLDEMEKAQAETKANLDEHIRVDDERNADAHRVQILRFNRELNADAHRVQILRFNRELLQGLPHTQEDFIEALHEIDFYEHYCRMHEEYENNRAVLAIENIKRAYMEWQKNQETHEA